MVKLGEKRVQNPVSLVVRGNLTIVKKALSARLNRQFLRERLHLKPCLEKPTDREPFALNIFTPPNPLHFSWNPYKKVAV